MVGLNANSHFGAKRKNVNGNFFLGNNSPHYAWSGKFFLFEVVGRAMFVPVQVENLIHLGLYKTPSFKDLWNTDYESTGRLSIAKVFDARPI